MKLHNFIKFISFWWNYNTHNEPSFLFIVIAYASLPILLLYFFYDTLCSDLKEMKLKNKQFWSAYKKEIME